MLKLDTRIELNGEKFWRWWSGELAFLVPRSVRKLFGAGRPRLVLSRSAEKLHAALWTESGIRELGTWALDEAGGDLRQRLFAENPELDEAQLQLRLDAAQALVKVFKLPAIAEENLHQVAGFELDRLTPFTPPQVYYDVKVLERLKETKQIRVELALTPKQTLDEILDELAGLGWKPERVGVGELAQTSAHDLLPEKFRQPAKRLPKILSIAAAALFTLLLIAVLALPIWKNQRQLSALQAQVKAVSKTALEVDALREDAEKLATENGFLLKKKHQEPALVDMLEELSKVIPDHTSLNGLQYREHKVIIQGMSPAASGLIALLEASPHFKNTSFVSPVTKDISNGQERFQIASEVVNGRFSEKPVQ